MGNSWQQEAAIAKFVYVSGWRRTQIQSQSDYDPTL